MFCIPCITLIEKPVTEILAVPQLLVRTRSELFFAGAYIARAGERADKLMIVVAGRVNISLPGKRFFIGQLGPGCVSLRLLPDS